LVRSTELVTVRLPGFGSGGVCATAGRGSRNENAAVTSGRHTYFDTNDFDNIDPPIWERRVSALASAPVAQRMSKMDATVCSNDDVRE
jgi:hypothetical protein